MISKTEGWILGERILLRYRNNTWEEITLPEPDVVLHTMSGLITNELWVASNQGFLFYTDGKWETSEVPTPTKFSAMLMLNENEGWAVGNGILHYTNR